MKIKQIVPCVFQKGCVTGKEGPEKSRAFQSRREWAESGGCSLEWYAWTNVSQEMNTIEIRLAPPLRTTFRRLLVLSVHNKGNPAFDLPRRSLYHQVRQRLASTVPSRW